MADQADRIHREVIDIIAMRGCERSSSYFAAT